MSSTDETSVLLVPDPPKASSTHCKQTEPLAIDITASRPVAVDTTG